MDSQIGTMKCFVSTPLEPDFGPIRVLVTKTLRDQEVQPLLMEPHPSSRRTDFTEAVQDQIRLSDFIIADLTGQSPNVTFEFGFASGLGKPALLIVQRASLESLVDYASYSFIVYDPDKLDELRKAIHAWLPSMIGRVRSKRGYE